MYELYLVLATGFVAFCVICLVIYLILDAYRKGWLEGRAALRQEILDKYKEKQNERSNM